MRLKLFVAIAVVMLSSGITARADTTVYSTSFEGPTFTTGPIAGQNGWNVYGSGVSTVENTFAYSGSQAVFINGNATQSGPYLYSPTSGPLVDLNAEIAIFNSTTGSGWQFAATGSNLTGYIGGIDIDPTTGAIYAITSGFPVIGTYDFATSFDSSAWSDINLLFNFTTQTYDISLNGVTLASNLSFCGNNAGPCTDAPIAAFGDGLFDALGNPGANDSAYMDDYSVTVINQTPEPSSIALLGTGLLGMVGILRKRFA